MSDECESRFGPVLGAAARALWAAVVRGFDSLTLSRRDPLPPALPNCEVCASWREADGRSAPVAAEETR